VRKGAGARRAGLAPEAVTPEDRPPARPRPPGAAGRRGAAPARF